LLLLSRLWSVSEPYLSSFFDVRSTLFHRLLRDTRHSDGSTGVFRLRRSLLRPCGLPEAGAWLSRTSDVLSLSCAWRSRSSSFRHATVVPELRVADLLFGSFREGACCSRAVPMTAVFPSGDFGLTSVRFVCVSLSS
jgi:hypothetical protein